MKRLILEQSNDEFYTSHSGLALVGACVNRYSDLGRRAGRQSRGTEQISDINILRSYLGLLSMGKSDFQAVTAMQGDDYFKHALAINRLPSAETLRQRLDAAATSGLIPQVFRATHTMLKQLGVKVSGCGNGLVPLDVDVFPQDNSNTSKEGVSRTYKDFDGYAPIAAYLGLEGWCLEVELRPGSQHAQHGFGPFLRRALKAARSLTDQECLARLDSAHDAEENRKLLATTEKVRFIIKWNPRGSSVLSWHERVLGEGTISMPRPGKRVGLMVIDEPMEIEGVSYPCRRIVRVTERTSDRNGQMLLMPQITLEGWWTNLDMAPEEVISLYRDHATSEQFHSEFKTDLDLERLPSGKFATNVLVMALGCLTYNILRAIGQMGLLGEFSPIRHAAKRRRIRTVMQELIYLAGRLLSRGRRLIVRFSRHCPGFAAFEEVYGQLVPAR